MRIITEFNKLGEYDKYSVILILVYAAVVLSLTSIYHVSGDACWHVQASKFIADNQRIPAFEPLGREEPFWSPPLYHLIVAVLYSWSGMINHDIANFAIKFISPAFGIFSLVLSFIVIKKITNSKIAFCSIIFLAFIPISIDYGVLSYIESVFIFFVLLSIYFLNNNRFILSGIAAGLSILTKYHGVLILPLLVFLTYSKYKDKRAFFKKTSIVVLIALAISVPWFIRNWIVFGNPIWPFLNFIFHGLESSSFSQANFGNLINPNFFIFTYLGTFGVPDGNYAAFSFFRISHLSYLFALWLFGTILFMLPLIIGFSVRNSSKMEAQQKLNKNLRWLRIFFLVWLLPYIILTFPYVINTEWSVSRIILPAFPAFAFFWALGYAKLSSKFKIKKIVIFLTILIISGFLFTETVKIKLASNEWDFYREDFNWIKSNTKKTAIFIAEGQCVPYNIERTSLYLNDKSLNKADYIWINQNFKLDKRSIFNEAKLKQIQSRNYNLVYSNKKTGTLIYSTTS